MYRGSSYTTANKNMFRTQQRNVPGSFSVKNEENRTILVTSPSSKFTTKAIEYLKYNSRSSSAFIVALEKVFIRKK